MNKMITKNRPVGGSLFIRPFPYRRLYAGGRPFRRPDRELVDGNLVPRLTIAQALPVPARVDGKSIIPVSRFCCIKGYSYFSVAGRRDSGCFRTERGAAEFCRLRSYVSTMGKQGRGVMEVIRGLTAGKALMPELRY